MELANDHDSSYGKMDKACKESMANPCSLLEPGIYNNTQGGLVAVTYHQRNEKVRRSEGCAASPDLVPFLRKGWYLLTIFKR